MSQAQFQAQNVKVVRSPRFFEDTVRDLVINYTSIDVERVMELLKKAGLLEKASKADSVYVVAAKDFEICDDAYVTITPLYGVVEETREIQYIVQDGPDAWTERGRCFSCKEPPCIFREYKAPDRVYGSYLKYVIVVDDKGEGGGS